MSLQETSGCRQQPCPDLHDGDGRGQAPECGAGGSDGMRDSLEQMPDVGESGAGMAQVIGIDAHDSFK